MLIGNKRLWGALTLCHTFPKSAFSARLAQSVELKALNLVVVGSSPTVGVSQHWASAWQARHAARPLSHVLADSCTEKTRPASSVCPHWVCPQHWASACLCTELGYKRHIVRACGQSSQARLAQSAERKALNLVVVGSSPTVGVFHVRIALMALPRGTGSPISLLAGGRSMWNAR